MAGVIRNPYDNPTDSPLVSYEMPSSFWLFGEGVGVKFGCLHHSGFAPFALRPFLFQSRSKDTSACPN